MRLLIVGGNGLLGRRVWLAARERHEAWVTLRGYGLTKRLGEVGAPHLAIRTALIGGSLAGTEDLVEWFLAHPGPVAGYRRAILSGLTAPIRRFLGEC